MIRSALFCLAGILFGSGIGFFVANNSVPVTAVAPASPREGNGAAPPLDPNQTSGELPPNHPPMDGAEGGGPANPDDKSGGAASSPRIQAAMDEADRNPKNYDLQLNAAAAFYNNGALDKAETYLKRALEAKPNDFDALSGLGNVKYDQGDYPAAQGFYEKALMQKKDPDVQNDLGNSFFKRKDYDRAIAEYRKALAVDPKHEKSWQNLAAAAIQKDDKTTAREAVGKLAAINPQNPALPSFRESLK
jgi:tetratricopeptide (TPR) repeat protein